MHSFLEQRTTLIPDVIYVLTPSTKECNYGIRASQLSSSLTKFIVNSVSIHVSK